MLAALVNHEMRRKDKESSSSGTTVEALTARRIGFNHRKGKGDTSNCKIGNHKLKKLVCFL